MYSRKFSLNKPHLILKHGDTIEGRYSIIKYLIPNTTNTFFKERHPLVFSRLEQETLPRFCIIASNKLTKKSVRKNEIKRAFSKGIEEYIKSQNTPGWFVIIPKKRILDENDKITVDVEKISTEIYSLLSEMVIA